MRRLGLQAIGLLALVVSQHELLRAQPAEPPAEPPPPPLAAPPQPLVPYVSPAEPPPSFYDQALQAPPLDFAAPAVLEVPGEMIEGTPEESPPPKIWSGRIELGYNGSEGNSQQSTTRAGAKFKRKTPEDEITLDFRYTTSSNETERTQNNWLFDWRFEDFLPGWPWSFFIHGIVEFDEFTAFDYRVTVDSGLAYNIIKDDRTDFQLRAGGGFSREYGIPDAEAVPEASYGFSFEHRIAKRQKLIAKGDMFPDVRDFSDYRALSEASWEILIDEAERLSLRLSVIDRYDATPGDEKKHNDLTYAAEIGWQF